jgi:hypothetical protein
LRLRRFLLNGDADPSFGNAGVVELTGDLFGPMWLVHEPDADRVLVCDRLGISSMKCARYWL